MQTDIEIARQARLQPIQTIADRLGIPAEAVSPYGRFIGMSRRSPSGPSRV